MKTFYCFLLSFSLLWNFATAQDIKLGLKGGANLYDATGTAFKDGFIFSENSNREMASATVL